MLRLMREEELAEVREQAEARRKRRFFRWRDALG